MLFSSLTFLFCFLPVTIALYYITPRRLRNTILLLASIFFYAWGEVRYLPIIFMTIGLSYAGAIFIEKFKHKKLWLILFILLDLSLLIYFKYANFVLENLNLIFHHNWSLKVVLPLGISFYTFQALSYLVDVYRGQVKAQSSFLKIALYICLFPQLIAGPIVKYHDIADQIDNRKETIDGIYYGIRRFIIGLSKKVLIANTLGALADKVFEQPVVEVGTGTAWIGAIAYTLQIYYDFSGYSDMAIGLGAIFGFKFLENFNYPFISKSISEYWRRWHISLSTWFRDYLFYPFSISLNKSLFFEKTKKIIGLKTTNTLILFLSLLIVWSTTGFWHGASWIFLIWGLYNGFFIMVEVLFKFQKYLKKVSLLAHLYTILIFIFGFIIFRSENLLNARDYICNMFGLIKHTFISYGIYYYIDHVVLITFIVGIICATPIFKNMINIENKKKITQISIDFYLFLLTVLCCAQLAANTYNPFIYFRF